ncbi:MAG TPA: N-acetylmuramoyl-L-alanine amidase, partial [Longimicrobiaceae bacterium]|nr:N-acetylmuramoyl-L-alanine amidase [Longimicrobiaceae bacterium]
MMSSAASRSIAGLLALLLIGACAPPSPVALGPEPEPAVGLPPIPRVEGALEIRVVHPTPQTPRPNVDSTFIYGSVGTGAASLTINGTPVEVAPNGAFLAFLPLPPDGRWELAAEAREQRARATTGYRPPAAAAPAAPAAPQEPVAVPEIAGPPAPETRVPTMPRALETVAFAQPLIATVTGVADTLATGSDVAVGRPTPTGTFRWFLPRGARVTVTGQRGNLLRAQLGAATEAWFADTLLALAEPAPTAPAPVGATEVRPAPEWVDVRIAAERAPFLVQPQGRAIAVLLYGRTAPAAPTPIGGDPLLTGEIWRAEAPDVARLELSLARGLWGYKAFYDAEGALVLRLRRPPTIGPSQPLQGVRIVIDPGHPPAGATGPTGLTEAEANLAISLPLAEQLRARGAEVTLTRTTGAPLVSATDQVAELRVRVNLAVQADAHLLVSVHNNAFAEGVNPFRNHGTSTYHFHPHAAELARALNQEIVATTRIPDLGARVSNLAAV